MKAGLATVAQCDPLACEFPLAIQRDYLPMGVPLHIATNSEEILAAADPAWDRYPLLPLAHPVTLRVIVEGRNAGAPVRPSMPSGEAHLISMVHGPDNYAVCDLSASFAFVRLTRDVAADSAYVRYHFLDPAVYLMIEASRFCPVHASCISWNGRAILLCGESGAGKTSLAYACARNGWTFLSGDATYILRDQSLPLVAGRPFSIRFRAGARDLFPELRVYVPEQRPNGKLDLEIDTSELSLSVAAQGRACCVVFLNRQRNHRSAGVTSFDRAEAILRLSQALCYGDRRIRAAQTVALRDFMELPVVELTYSDFEGAEKALRVLASGAV